MHESALIENARTGDRESFAELVRLHQSRLRAYAARFIENADDVYDVVQDAFLDSYRNLNSFDSGKDFGQWLRGICHNRVRNYFRMRKSRRMKAMVLIDDAIEEKISQTAAHSEVRGDRIDALKHCLSELQPEHRELLRERYFDGSAIRDLAGKSERTDAAVGMLLMRLRAVLQKCVERRLQGTV
jgi:RNA polymerase sigma-70 factor, ECF subfamily